MDFLKMYNQTVKADDLKNQDAPPKVYPAVMDRERLPVIPYLTIPDCQCQNETVKPVEELNFSKENNYLKYLVLLGLVLIPFIVKK